MASTTRAIGVLFWCLAAAACSGKEPEKAAAAATTQASHAERQTPGDFDDCAGADWCPRMVSLPAGTFVMGSPMTEPGRFDDEDPKKVSLGPFAVGKYLVTRAQWAAFVKASKRRTPAAPCAYAPSPHPSWSDPGFAQDGSHPVVCISWSDAQDYARWLSDRTGHHYRLLTDEEWEYASRAGTTTAFPWGGKASHEHANYGLDECCGPATSGRDRWEFTSPVGSFPANGFGLYDMQGNVFEWVETCADLAEKLPIPKGAKGCAYRYARGGVYADRPTLMRSAAKNLAPPPGDVMTIGNYRSAGFGLRVARDIASASRGS